MKRKYGFVFAVLCMGSMAVPVAQAASSPKVPGCTDIEHAIQSAYDGQISSVDDRTAQVKALESHGSAPYSVLRACQIRVSGHRIPLTVSIDAPVGRRFLDAMARFAAKAGRKPQKLTGTGYGDLAYLLPQMGGGYAVNALVGNRALTIGNWATAKQTKNMARHIIALMR